MPHRCQNGAAHSLYVIIWLRRRGRGYHAPAAAVPENATRDKAVRQTPLLFRQIGDQLGVADCQRKLKLVFQPGFLQHIRHMEFDR